MKYSLANPIIQQPTFADNPQVTESSGNALQAVELTIYDDINPTQSLDAKVQTMPLYDFKDTSGGINNFLRRPVLMSTINWTAATTTTTFINPWEVLSMEPAFNEKLKYFHGIRADVKIKIVLNGTPFHYGRAIMFYMPLAGNNSRLRASYRGRVVNNPMKGGYYMVKHAILDPTVSRPVEMLLPFEGPEDFSRFSTSGDVGNLSRVDMLGTIGIAIDTPLASSQAAVPEPVTIQVYGWFENVTLGPVVPVIWQPVEYEQTLPALEEISDVEIQGGEATGTGPVSSVASAVARAASALKNVPLIGRFARATEIGSNAVAGIASLFGFSVPISQDRYQVVKNQLASNFSFTTARDTSHKLTLDPLQELTIDPTAYGFSSKEDEMSYAFLYKIPTLIRRSTWAVGAAEGTLIANVPVTPALTAAVNPTTLPTTWYPSPLNGLAMNHRYWTGKLKYRVEVIASAYHKGRIQVRYMPVSNQANTSNTNPGFGEPTSQTVIMDLSVDHVKEFTVGWSGSVQMKECGRLIPSTSTYTYENNRINGIITVEVLTKLTAPATVAPVTVLIFVEGTEDLRFLMPTNIYTSQVTVQGGTAELLSTEGEISSTHFGGPEKIPDGFDKVFQGERIVSLRSLLKRFVPIGRQANLVTPAKVLGPHFMMSKYFLDWAVNFPTGRSNEIYFSLDYNNYFNMWKLAYVATRGSMRYKVMYFPGSGNANPLNPTRSVISRNRNFATNGLEWVNSDEIAQRCSEGFAIVDNFNALVEFEVPDYGNVRSRINNFDFAYGQFNSGSKDGVVLATLMNVNPGASGQVKAEVFVAGGEDFSLLSFYCLPPLVQGLAWADTIVPV